jgi:hypothetical protein
VSIQWAKLRYARRRQNFIIKQLGTHLPTLAEEEED